MGRRAAFVGLVLFGCAPPPAPPAAPLDPPAAPLDPPAAPAEAVAAASPPAQPTVDVPAASVASVIEPLPRTHDCDPGGKEPRLCVAPAETEGPVRTGACREAPRQPVCTGCRPVFERVEAGRCCYLGLSRRPRCLESPTHR
jgi:hypothetical protein